MPPFLIHKYNDNRIDNNVLLLGLEQSRSFLLEYIHNIEYILGMDKSELRNLNFQRSKTDFQKKKKNFLYALLQQYVKGQKRTFVRRKLRKQISSN